MTDHTIAAIIYEAMLWGNDQPKRPQGIASYIPFGNSDAEVEARRFADRIVGLSEYDRVHTATTAAYETAAQIAHDHTPEKHSGATLASHVTGRNIEAAIRALITEEAIRDLVTAVMSEVEYADH